MSLITRFNGAFKAFASEATGTFRTVFGGTTQSNDLTDNLTADFKTGWEIVGTNDEPTIEDFNAMGYTLSQVLAYVHQVGIIEWSGTDGVVGGQDYYAGISFVGYDGDIYLAILDSGGSIEARVPTNATYWRKVSNSTLDISSLTAKTTPVDADLLLLSDSASSFANKKLTWANLKDTLLTYFDTLYSRTYAIFGVGQTWQDVTASRALGTTYTNTTGKPIQVVMYGAPVSSGNNTLVVDGISISSYITNDTPSGASGTISGIVPHGSTYSITGSIAISKWSELR